MLPRPQPHDGIGGDLTSKVGQLFNRSILHDYAFYGCSRAPVLCTYRAHADGVDMDAYFSWNGFGSGSLQCLHPSAPAVDANRAQKIRPQLSLPSLGG
jgi:hypothetical protein